MIIWLVKNCCIDTDFALMMLQPPELSRLRWSQFQSMETIVWNYWMELAEVVGRKLVENDPAVDIRWREFQSVFGRF